VTDDALQARLDSLMELIRGHTMVLPGVDLSRIRNGIERLARDHAGEPEPAVEKPLSPHALLELEALADGPVPRAAMNPGVVSALLRRELVELVLLGSPYVTHKGAKIEHVRLRAK